MDQDLSVEESQHPQSESQESIPETTTETKGEQSLDEIIDAEQKEAEALDESDSEEDVDEAEDGDDSDSEEESEDYKPNPKYKVLDEEHEFDPKLKSLLTKETEPLIRELYEKAHGIESIKESRTQAVKERDEVRGNYNNLVGEVGRILNYKRAGDLQSFFESVQLDDNTLAKYILEKARIAQLPPEQQTMYNERETLRRRVNALEQNFQGVQTANANAEVHALTSELDNVLADGQVSRLVKDFDARNGKGAFKTAVINHGAQQWTITKKDLTPAECVESFTKMVGLSVPQGQPKPGAMATKRVVARSKVKTIPNYGGGQASVTATKKPKSTEDLRKILREMQNS